LKQVRRRKYSDTDIPQKTLGLYARLHGTRPPGCKYVNVTIGGRLAIVMAQLTSAGRRSV